MKRIICVLTALLISFSFSSCDVEKIAEYINIGVNEDNFESESVLVGWESDEINFESDHNGLEKEEYYRYGKLSEEQKSVYDSLYEAVNEGISVLDIDEFELDSGELEDIFRIFIADNPQLFYVSRTCQYIYNTDDGKVSDILIKYTDGKITDEFDANCKLVETADREVIAEKIEDIENVVNGVLEDIPVDASDIEKEKAIHDYLVSNIEYNKSVQNNFTDDETIPHYFDSYGALVLGEAVCEGYAKAFQLLCYEVGLNCAQIEGYGNSSEHMWNAVLLDDWYYVDVTWDDDVDGEGYLYYEYFNVSEDVLEKDHEIDTSVLDTPRCDSDKYSYYNYFCVKVDDLRDIPLNYKRMADEIASGDMTYVVIYADGVDLTTDYIIANFLDEKSVFQEYVEKMNYDIALENEYYIIGNYYYIPA